MTIAAEESNVFKEVNFTSSDDKNNSFFHQADTNYEHTHLAPNFLGKKGEGGFNSTDKNLYSAPESNSVCSADGQDCISGKGDGGFHFSNNTISIPKSNLVCAANIPEYISEKGNSGFNFSDNNASSILESNLVFSADVPEQSKNETSCKDSTVKISPLTTKLSDSPTSFSKFLRDGSKIGLSDDLEVPIDKVPDWFDSRKCQLGRKFGQTYYFGITFAQMVSLYLLFLPKGALEPLIFTGNSHSPYKAFKRYLSTTLRVKTWIDSDIWDPISDGFKNLQTVRALHLNVSKKMNDCSISDIEQKATMAGEPGEGGVWCPMYEGIKKDILAACPFGVAHIRKHPLENAIGYPSNRSYFCQTDMSLTQFGFVGLVLLYPEKFGAASASDEELEGFAHLWRCVGYLLGVEDDLNFCQGTLSQVRQRCAHALDLMYKPCLQEVSAEWEHMSRCMAEGVSYYVLGTSFEVSFSYLCWVLGVEVRSVTSSLNFYQKCMFFLTKLLMCYTSKIPAVLRFYNRRLRRILEKVQRQPKEWHDRLERRRYDFQKHKHKNSNG